MRLEGKSYRDIQEQLGIPKSTLSYWLSDVALTDEQRAALDERRGGESKSRAAAIRASRIRRTEVLQQEAAREIGSISDRELFLLGVMAYWCEGTKEKPWAPSTPVSFINSDVNLLRLFLRWLLLLGVTLDELTFTLSIHERADVELATAHWAAVVGVPVERFMKPNLKRHNPRTVRYNTTEAYAGCLTVRVRRSVDLNRRIAGWWAGIVSGVDQPVDTINPPSGMV